MKKNSALREKPTPNADEAMTPEVAPKPAKKITAPKSDPTSGKTPVKTPAKKPVTASTKAPSKALTKPPAKAPAKAASKAAPKTSVEVTAKASVRSPARSPTQSVSKPRKPVRPKTPALAPTPEPTPSAELLGSEVLIAAQANETSSLDTSADDNAAPAIAQAAHSSSAVTPPVVSDAELWEQGSPIRLRIAQLRTRNSLLEEQLQRLRPPFQVRGKKK